MRARLVGLVLLILVALLILVLLNGMRFPPDIPLDRDHRSGQTPRQCLNCHGPEASTPRGPNHPLGNQCFQCHQQ